VSDCLFCRIIARQSPADITYEDDAVVAFKDIYPKAPVHQLIVPRRHIASLLEATEDDIDVLGRCVLTARRLAEATGYAERGFRLGVNTGPVRTRSPVRPSIPAAGQRSPTRRGRP
jgi:histidine triad (HIT) family protein